MSPDAAVLQPPRRVRCAYPGVSELEDAIVLNDAGGWLVVAAGQDDAGYWALYQDGDDRRADADPR